jgi:oligopeptide/dipeptide ABC transporter ATP-binding protein
VALRRVVHLLRKVKIVSPEMRLHSFPHELSGGMRQRTASAAAIGCQPSLLIADEPTTALDVTTQRQYLELLKELQAAAGMAIIFVTHDISLVGNMCDQIAVFYGGIIVEYGPKDLVLTQPSHPYTEALLQSIPRLGDRRDRLRSIRGDPPDMSRRPAGCPFHPRCDAAVAACTTGAPPPAFALADGRQTRCWLREPHHVRNSVGSL